MKDFISSCKGTKLSQNHALRREDLAMETFIASCPGTKLNQNHAIVKLVVGQGQIQQRAPQTIPVHVYSMSPALSTL